MKQIEDAIKEIQYINEMEEKNSLYKEQRATLKTIKSILYKHAMESEFQLADKVFIEQIQFLNELFDTYWKTKHGEWIDLNDSDEIYGDLYKCPFCENIIVTGGIEGKPDNYCGNCGAKLEAVKYE